MNPSTWPEVLSGAAEDNEYRAISQVGTLPQERCPNEHTPPLNSEGPYVPDEANFELFAGGAGI